MFSNIGWTEMLVIAVVAVIFVGPKDLPSMLRTFGRFSRKVRGIAGDFQRQVDDALREAELDDVRKSIEDVRSLSPKRMVSDHLKGLDDDLRADLDDVATGVDETKAPAAAKAETVDVDAALERQRKLDEAAKTDEPTPLRNSGTNAVPGFASADPGPKPAEPKVEA